MLLQSKATYSEAGKNLKRVEDLFQKGMVAQQDLDASRRAYEVAQSQYQAAIADAVVKKDYSVIRAPFNGVIAKKTTEVGELLMPGKEIVTIVNPDKIYVLATIDEVDVGRLKIGLPVAITVDAFPGEKFDGIDPPHLPDRERRKARDPHGRCLDLFQQKDPARSKPGMSADVEILITTLQDVLSVPSQAVIEREGKKQVYVAERQRSETRGEGRCKTQTRSRSARPTGASPR